jgi:hypothetical protein
MIWAGGGDSDRPPPSTSRRAGYFVRFRGLLTNEFYEYFIIRPDLPTERKQNQ